jgi:hypothetical protein
MKDVKLIYHSGFWDGPLSGVCEYQDKRYWFKCVHDYQDHSEKILDMRIYGVYELTPKEWENEIHWHTLFQKHVGMHTEYDDAGSRSYGKVGPQKDHHKFYDAAKGRKRLDLEGREAIGFFDRREMKFRESKYRDYWLVGETPYSIHNKHCPCTELVEWRNDAHCWDHFDSDFEGKTSGWSISAQPDGPNEGQAHWMIAKFCPWCGKDLKEESLQTPA